MSLTNIVLGLFLILFGVLGLVATEIPRWVVHALAVVAGILVLFFGWRDRNP